MAINATLYGTLVGRIWMPAQVCSLDISVNLNRERDRYRERGGCLRHMLCGISNDGDFQSASFTPDSFIRITSTRVVGNQTWTRSRDILIQDFAGMEDLIASDELMEELYD